MNRRRLTVSRSEPQSRASRFPRRLPQPMPFLRLRGRWLALAGFAIGKPVRVTTAPGLIVLEVIDDERD
jgi:Toxin SymE, type I toxin-antitoxin system